MENKLPKLIINKTFEIEVLELSRPIPPEKYDDFKEWLEHKAISNGTGKHYDGYCLDDENDNVINVIFQSKTISNPKEYILCAAIHNPEEKDITGEPLIYSGYRHCNILWQSKLVSRNPYHQGFLTNKGRFVNREEALIIALKNSQVLDLKDVRGNQLYSEDLY